MTSLEECSLAIPLTSPARSSVDLAALVETHAALLFRVAHSVLRNRPEAEDVVQDTFVRVLQHRAHPRYQVNDLRVWLIRITWNLALDRRRRIHPQQMDDLFAESLVARTLPADQALLQAQRLQAVLREWERLPKPERNVLLLAAIDELSTPEIAAVLGKSDSAVRALLFRARSRLRTRLEKATPAVTERSKP